MILGTPVTVKTMQRTLERTTEDGLCHGGVEGRGIFTPVGNLWNLLSKHKPRWESKTLANVIEHQLFSALT